MEIHLLDTVPSTQGYLIDKIKRGEIVSPTALLAREQTAGVGSRSNRWEGGMGNFFASFALRNSDLPDDLPISSASIYFAYLMKNALRSAGHHIWLKWPNDLYSGEEKIGGVITKKLKGFFVVGIGINLKKNENHYSALDTETAPLLLFNIFLNELEKLPSWKHIFSKYKLEFEQSKPYFAHKNGIKMPLDSTELCSDGSLSIQKENTEEKVYSLR